MEPVKSYQIIFDADRCIGSGACAAVTPSNWQMQPDGKTKPRKTEISESELGENLEAARGCPVNAIQILGKTGKQLV